MSDTGEQVFFVNALTANALNYDEGYGIEVFRGTGTSLCIGSEQAVVSDEMGSGSRHEFGQAGDEVSH